MMDQHEQQPKLTRREKERLARRNGIIEAARQVFAYKGFTNATLDEIAELAEFGKTSLYNYFKTKEELFENVIISSFEEIKAIARQALETDEPFEVRIRQFAEWELRYFYDNIESFYLIRNESHHLRETNPLFRMMPELLNIVADAIRIEQEAKRMKEGDPFLYALMLSNLISTRAAAHIYSGLLREDGTMECATLQDFGGQLRTIKSQNPADVCDEADFVTGMFLHGAMR